MGKCGPRRDEGRRAGAEEFLALPCDRAEHAISRMRYLSLKDELQGRQTSDAQRPDRLQIGRLPTSCAKRKRHFSSPVRSGEVNETAEEAVKRARLDDDVWFTTLAQVDDGLVECVSPESVVSSGFSSRHVGDDLWDEDAEIIQRLLRDESEGCGEEQRGESPPIVGGN